MIERHFKMHLELMKDPTGGVNTAACRNCICCGDMLSSMGGGGEYMCETCYLTIYSNQLRMQFRSIKHERK